VKHGFGDINRQEWSDVLGLFDYLKEKSKKITVIKGNHDVLLGSIALKKGIEVKDFHIVGEYCFIHGDKDFLEIHDKKIKHWVVGHAHASVKIFDPKGVKVEKYKCFFVGKHGKKKVTVMPSFFHFYEGSDPRESWLGMAWDFDFENFDVKVVSGNGLEVLDFGKLKKLD
jgi:putative SbcD/Mre11-related phosphoesterase